MTYPPPPPLPDPELVAHQAATLEWGRKHNYYPANEPPPLPPLPVMPLPVSAPAVVTAGTLATIVPRKKINARSKGQRGEREIIGILQELVDRTRVARQLAPIVLQRNTLQAHLGGDDLVGLGRFSCEVKRVETDYNEAWWRQAVRQAGDTKVPILFYRRNKVAWAVKVRAYVSTPCDRDQHELDITLSLEDFILWFTDAYDECCLDESQSVAYNFAHL